jgi:glycosyltransferase involved in cell wall biosynthesis
MKILVVSHSCVQPVNQDLYAEMASLRDWEMALVVPARWKDEFGNRLDLPPRDCWRGGVVKAPVWLNGNIILHAYRIGWKQLLADGGYDVVYVNHEPYAVATAQLALACRQMKNPPALGFYSCQNLLKNYPFPFSAMERGVYEQARFAFPITAAVAGVLEKKGYRHSMTVLPLPVDTYRCRAYGIEEDCALVPREEGEVVIGYIGRLVEAKGLGTLARALGEIRDLRWKLVLVGSGEYEQTLRSLLEATGLRDRAHFLGYIPHEDTPRYLSAFDLLVLPSETQPNWEEQFGRVIPEALACGTCVLGSDSGEIPQLIGQSGGGEIFLQRDVRSLAAALRGLLTDHERRTGLAKTGQAWVSSHLSLRATAARMADTLSDIHENRS